MVAVVMAVAVRNGAGGEIVKYARISTSEENLRSGLTTDITLTAVDTPTVSSRAQSRCQDHG